MKKYFSIVVVLIFSFINCTDDKKSVAQPAAQSAPNVPRDYAIQYNEDLYKIEDFLKTHSITVINHADFTDDQDASFAIVPNLDSNSIWGDNAATPKLSLLVKLATVGGVAHKIYYIKFREGVGASPNINSTIRAVFSGFLTTNMSAAFDKSVQQGAVFSLNQLIFGWREILPEFKMGTVSSTNVYSDFGAGVMFLPSAFGYYDKNTAQIPAYSPLIFTIKLYNVL